MCDEHDRQAGDKSGAPMIEVTPEMVDGWYRVFNAWWDKYGSAIRENGSQGDPDALLAALCAEWKYGLKSLGERPSSAASSNAICSKSALSFVNSSFE